jgi:hypothetical protein
MGRYDRDEALNYFFNLIFTYPFFNTCDIVKLQFLGTLCV